MERMVAGLMEQRVEKAMDRSVVELGMVKELLVVLLVVGKVVKEVDYIALLGAEMVLGVRRGLEEDKAQVVAMVVDSA